MAPTEHRAATELLVQAYFEQSIHEAQSSDLTSIINNLLPKHIENSDLDLNLDLDDGSNLANSLSNSNSEPDMPPHEPIQLGGSALDSGQTLLEALILLHSSQYLNECIPILKSGDQLCMTLHKWHYSRPEIFWGNVWVDPTTFNALVHAIQDDPVFHNNSNNAQIPVEEQVTVALYHLGHYGNAVGIQAVGLWAGWGVGTVDLVTHRFFVTICQPTFFQVAVSWPSEDDQEKAHQWVEDQTCPDWCNGWLMVDGTLVVLDH
ncbi:hypothetical protein FRC11_005002 [Ceratobasidium sp. 423]|nr:hypothetical protein FRC11_005002 [Ceratobasidium sp. 423]